LTHSVLVLGAGFGELEASARLVELLGDEVRITLIDRSDSFVFGFTKLEIMFARRTRDAVRLRYRDMVDTGVRFLQETITSIDPVARRVVTDQGDHRADLLVVALGADYDLDATPGLREAGFEFYSVDGAERLRSRIDTFSAGTAIVGVCGAPFKCPPAPSEAAFLLDDHLRARGSRERVRIQVVIPFGVPIPPSPDTSSAILARFADRGIEFVRGRRVAVLDPRTREAVLDDGSRLPFDLFLGVPVHRVPAVVAESGLAENGWIPVEPRSAATRFEGVYALGHVTSVGTPKAGVFAERAARAMADQVAARLRGMPIPPGYDGTGACWIEFGGHEVARVDVDFFAVPGRPTGTFTAPSAATAAEKASFAATRAARWFGPGAALR